MFDMLMTNWAVVLHVFVASLFTVLTVLCHVKLQNTKPGDPLPLLCKIHPMGFLLNSVNGVLVNKGNAKLTASFVLLALMPGVNLMFTLFYSLVFLYAKYTDQA